MRVPLTSRRLLLFASACVLGLMAGCASSPSTTTEDTPAPDSSVASENAGATGSAVHPTCALAPVSVIKETLKIDVSAPTETSSAGIVECSYMSAASGHNVIVRFSTDQDANTFAGLRDDAENGGEPTTDVSGVGDEAYQSSVEFGDTVTNTMVARKGTVAIQVDAVASLDAEKALLTKLFAALA
jgi:hypothetical protein